MAKTTGSLHLMIALARLKTMTDVMMMRMNMTTEEKEETLEKTFKRMYAELATETDKSKLQHSWGEIERFMNDVGGSKYYAEMADISIEEAKEVWKANADYQLAIERRLDELKEKA